MEPWVLDGGEKLGGPLQNDPNSSNIYPHELFDSSTILFLGLRLSSFGLHEEAGLLPSSGGDSSLNDM